MPVTLSIVTPSYNQRDFLEETLRSVISQRDQIHEYIVLDGGSTDGSVDLIRAYEPWISHWSSAPDKGQSDAIHRGFTRCTGDYLFWLNSDDLLLPGALERVRRALDSNPQWDVLTGYHVSIDQASRIQYAYRIPGESRRWAAAGVLHVCQQTCFFRRSLYEKLGGLDLSLHCVMDTDLWLRMLDSGSKWGHIPEYLAAFRKHADAKGVSQNWAQRYRQEGQDLSERFAFFGTPSVKHRLGRLLYRASQIASGRYPLAALDTARWRGRKVQEVFGSFEVRQPAPGGASATSTGGGARVG